MECYAWIDPYRRFFGGLSSTSSISSSEVSMDPQDSHDTDTGQCLVNDIKGLDQKIRTRYLQCLIQLGFSIDPSAEHLHQLTYGWVLGALCNCLSTLCRDTSNHILLDILRRVLVYSGGPRGPPGPQHESTVLKSNRTQIINALSMFLDLQSNSFNEFSSPEGLDALLQKSEAFKDAAISSGLIRQRHNDLACSLRLKSNCLEFCESASLSNLIVVLARGGAWRGDTEDSSSKDSYYPAEWLNARGIHAYILSRYTCTQDKPSPLLSDPFDDVEDAVNFVRKKHPGSRVGLWGFSAGGLMASMLNRLADFTVLVYPVTSMETDIANMECRDNLLGPQPSDDQIFEYSAARLVNDDTGPTYVFHSRKDQKVKVEHSLRLLQAYNKARRPLYFVLVPDGPHGAHGVDDLIGLDEFLQHIRNEPSPRVTRTIDLSKIESTGEQDVVIVQNYEVL